MSTDGSTAPKDAAGATAQRNLPAQPALRTRRHRAGVPRTRRCCPTAVLGSCARRAREIDRVILASFMLGPFNRKVGEILPPLLGRPLSPATVSRVARTLDAAVAAFHRRHLANRCKALMPDGVVLARKTGADAVRRPVPVATGILPDGGARRSSTSSSPAAKAPPNGSACPTPSTGAASPAKALK